jgi:hypothetical protein
MLIVNDEHRLRAGIPSLSKRAIQFTLIDERVQHLRL